jgi:broad specificity phosphatase PhoE
MRLILVRHAESSWNQEKRIQSFSDTELNQRGEEQAKRIALALREEKVNAIYSSPLKRAVETAEAIARVRHLEVNIDPDLGEIDCGELEGLTLEEVRSQYSDFWREWREGKGSLQFPKGESLEQLQRRAWGAIQRLIERQLDGVVVISHAFTILAIICHALELDITHFRRFKQDVAAINILNFGEQETSLILFNDTCHLVNGEP